MRGCASAAPTRSSTIARSSPWRSWGEFLSLDTETGLFCFFRRHCAEWFPELASLHRTTFTRQAANLWKPKKLMWQRLLETRVEHDQKICLLDSFAVPVSGLAKAPRHKSFAGVIVSASLAPANEHDRWVAEYDLLAGVKVGTFVVGDTNYHSPVLKGSLAGYGVNLIAPVRTNNKRKVHPWPRWLTNARRRIETVTSQMVERYRAKRVRDLWHLTSRLLRKVLSHTVSVCLCQRAGLGSLRFSDLVVL